MTATPGRAAGRTAIVTGAASGIGEAIAKRLAADGAQVLVCDIDTANGERVITEIGAAARFHKLDVVSADGWQAAVEAAEAAFGPVSILVNNAGILDMAPIDTMSEAAFRRVVDVNQVGPFLGTKAVVPSMRKAGGGAIVNISSAAGLIPLARMASYVASKFAVTGLTKVASIDLAQYGIRVNSVHPGSIATPLTAGATAAPKLQAIKRHGQPAEIASMVAYLVSDEASFCTGAAYVVDGGFLNVVGEVHL
jgi:3alpha(or 20beta)-hydroxysteroid dehydrogenase